MIDDLSDLICEIKVNLDALAFIQAQKSLKDRMQRYTAECEKVLGTQVKTWQYLPRSALERLAKKLKEEIKSENR